MPSVNVAVFNEAGELLLIRRSDNDNWALPGGGVDLGESLAQAAVRETREESGIECEITGLSGIYTDPGHVMLYTSNGEVRQEFSIVLTARAAGGQPTESDETSEARWVPSAEVGSYQMDRSMRLRVSISAGAVVSPTSPRREQRHVTGRGIAGCRSLRVTGARLELRRGAC